MITKCLVDSFHEKDKEMLKRKLSLEDNEIYKLIPELGMLDILVEAKIFESKSKARSEGWTHKVPMGRTSIGNKNKLLIINFPSKDAIRFEIDEEKFEAAVNQKV